MSTGSPSRLPSIPRAELDVPLPQIVEVQAGGPSGQAEARIDLLAGNGRSGMAPKLGLTYRSGAPNGVFGIGWSLDLPTIRRTGDSCLPRYRDAGPEADVFTSTEAGELVPALIRDVTGWRARRQLVDGIDVRYYRARNESEVIRLERHTHAGSGRSHWVSRSRDNVTRVYGRSDHARIVDPTDPSRVAEWLLEEVSDAYGNRIAYRYKPEDLAGVSVQDLAETRRLRSGAAGAARHPKRVLWGNSMPNQPDRWLFELVFDYGEHDDDRPTPDDSGRPWALRADPHSSYRTGFEVRTRRLCRRVLLFHHFPELGPEASLVRAHELSHAQQRTGSELTSVTLQGYRRDDPAGPVRTQQLPPVEFTYTDAGSPGAVEELSDSAALGGAPSSMTAAQWIDLEGDGLVGLLSHDGCALRYKPNLGGGRFGAATALRERPAVTAGLGVVSSVGQPFANGHSCLLDFGETPSFQQRTSAGTWDPFTPFPSAPSARFTEATSRHIDLNGDGRAELVVADEHGLSWHSFSGHDGWDPVQAAHDLTDAHGALNDRTGSVVMADMTGDGLTDLVRVRPGSVSYWPNLGYGRFGARVDMSGAPPFEGPDDFDPARVRLADIDGSGTADLLYLGRHGVTWYANECGNGFGSRREVPGLPPITDLETVAVIDLLSTGTGCLVWSSPAPAHHERPIRYAQLTRGQPPHLLRQVRNNVGGEISISYTPSTQLMLEDRARGRPWQTTLPFCAQVPTELRRRDRVTGAERVSTWRYRHGYYDDRAREPRGFAYVEQRDTDIPAMDPAGGSPAPPARETRSWYHTGAYLDREPLEHRLSSEFYAGDPLRPPPPTITIDDPGGLASPRELARSLHGRPLREEVYGLDGGPRSVVPYSVTDHGYLLRALQPAMAGTKPAVAAHEQQRVEYAYERVPDDPRVSHHLALSIDEAGTEILSADVFYPRRVPVEPEQARSVIIITQREVANALDQPGWYRIGVPVAEHRSELVLAPPRGGSLFDPTDLRRVAVDPTLGELPADAPVPEGGPPRRRRLNQREWRYWREDLSGPANGGDVGPRSLLYQEQQLAFTADLLRSAYGDRVDNAMLEAAGYSRRGDTWWAPGERLFYQPEVFYQPIRSETPLGTGRTIRYDPHALFVAYERRPDPIGDEHRATYDYQALRPATLTDPNGAQTHLTYTPLGLPSAVAEAGARGEGDTPADPTTSLSYDVLAWMRGWVPVSTSTASRHRHRDPGTIWERTVTYRDGFGRPIEEKTLAEPGPRARFAADGQLVRGPDSRPLVADSGADPRWVTMRRVVLAGDNALREYRPCATEDQRFLSEEQVAALAPVTRTTIDALGRTSQVDGADGTVRRSIRTAWQLEEWDENDAVRWEEDGMVRESRWYQTRVGPGATDEDRAAARAAAEHAGTPTVTYLDPAGRAFLQVDDNGGGRRFQTRSTLDAAGALRALQDPRGVVAERRNYDLMGRQVSSESADAGETRVLYDIEGRPSRLWGARGQEQWLRYDPAGRLTHREVRQGQDTWHLREWRVYGNQLGDTDGYQRGRLSRVFDGAGQLRHVYDFHGHPVLSERTLRADITTPANWTPVSRARTGEELANLARPVLGERLPTNYEYDATGRILGRTTPDESAVRIEYGRRGLPATITATVAGADRSVLVEAKYDAAGRQVDARFGNGVHGSMAYDNLSGKLLGLTTRLPDGSALRDQAFTTDAVGNVLLVRDAAQQTRFFANAPVRGDRSFGYDPLYRLVAAKGREAALPPLPPDRGSDPPIGPLPPPNDPSAVREYTETFDYDSAGNLTRVDHTARRGSWTVRYDIAPNANRVVGLRRRNGMPLPGRFEYDAAGNSLAVGALTGLGWDDDEHLAVVDLGGGGTAYHAYDSGGLRVHSVVQRTAVLRDEWTRLDGWQRWWRTGPAGRAESEVATLLVGDGQVPVAVGERRRSGAAPGTTIWRYQQGDPVGTVTLETDAGGNVLTFEEYRPYGGSAYRAAPAATPPKRYRFRGAERDDDTGLDLHGVRSYAPWLGRWISPDPAGTVDGPNRYAFVRGNPIAFVDPAGTQAIPRFQAQARTNSLVGQGVMMELIDESTGETSRSHGAWQLTPTHVGRVQFVPGSGAEVHPSAPSASTQRRPTPAGASPLRTPRGTPEPHRVPRGGSGGREGDRAAPAPPPPTSTVHTAPTSQPTTRQGLNSWRFVLGVGAGGAVGWVPFGNVAEAVARDRARSEGRQEDASFMAGVGIGEATMGAAQLLTGINDIFRGGGGAARAVIAAPETFGVSLVLVPVATAQIVRGSVLAGRGLTNMGTGWRTFTTNMQRVGEEETSSSGPQPSPELSTGATGPSPGSAPQSSPSNPAGQVTGTSGTSPQPSATEGARDIALRSPHGEMGRYARVFRMLTAPPSPRGAPSTGAARTVIEQNLASGMRLASLSEAELQGLWDVLSDLTLERQGNSAAGGRLNARNPHLLPSGVREGGRHNFQGWRSYDLLTGPARGRFRLLVDPDSTSGQVRWVIRDTHGG